MNLIPLVLLGAMSAQTMTVVSVEEHSVFAGKLGETVMRTLEVDTTNGRKSIALNPYHTACYPHPKAVHAGDRVMICQGEAKIVR